jgi:MoxR-like ATPase
MKIHFGYVDEETELDIYKNYAHISENLEHIQQVLSLEDILRLQEEADDVMIHDELIRAVSNLVRGTRTHEGISLGASTRSGITFIKCLKAYALVQGRTYVIEDDILDIGKAVLDHRLIYQHKEGRQSALQQLIEKEMNRLRKLKLS